MVKKLSGAVLICAALALIGCGGKKSAETAVEYKDTMHIAVSQQAPSLDLHKNSSLIARQMCSGTVWEKLVTLNEKAEPVPELCESYTMSSDAKEFVFNLRKGVKFHDGTEMTADDVCASMNRWTKSFSVAGTLVGGALFEKVDDYTVKISMESSALTLPDVIAGAAQPAMITTVASCADQDDKGFVKSYIGTGPYKFVEWIQDQYVKFEKFDDYVPYGTKGVPMDGWAGYKDSQIKTLYFDLVKESATRAAGLQTGQYDFIFDVSDDTAAMVSAIPGVQQVKAEEGTVAYVFNKKKGLATNQYIRQAVNAVINCEDVLRATYGEFFNLGSCYMDASQGFWVTDAGSANYNQKNIPLAKEFLAKAGYNGETFRILAPTLNNMDKGAMVLQQELIAAGINCELNVVDWATMTQYRTNADIYDMYVTSFASVPVPSLKLYFGPAYPGWTEDGKTQELMANFNTATTKDAAKTAWNVLQEYSWDYLPLINVGHYIKCYAWSEKLSGVNTFNGVYFWNAELKK